MNQNEAPNICPQCGKFWEDWDEDVIMYRCECGYVVCERET